MSRARRSLALLGLSLLASGVGGHASADVFDPLAAHMARGRLILGSSAHRLLHFTFDDGPRLSTPPRLLDYLDEAGVKGTFFVLGRNMRAGRVGRQQADIVRDAAQRGHTIGLHGFQHRALPSLSDEEIEADTLQAQARLEEVLGARPWLFRPPFGARNGRTDRVIQRLGYTQMLWGVHVQDSADAHTTPQVLEAFREGLDLRERHPKGPGTIVILHDPMGWSVDAFPGMIDEVRRRNCALLEAGEELWVILDRPDPFFTPKEPGDDSIWADPVVFPPEQHAAMQACARRAARRYCGAGR